MLRNFSVSLLILVLLGREASAFVTKSLAFFVRPSSQSSSSAAASSTSKLQMIDTPTAFVLSSDCMSSVNSLLISTIDSDIANISTDQFGLVFAGGIAVMIGSVISAMMVGLMLEKGDLYASVAAESYIQSGDDEAFWKSLSDEEQVKARNMLNKIKSSKESAGGSSSSNSSSSSFDSSSDGFELTKLLPSFFETPNHDAPPSEPADMFSDYSSDGFSDYGSDGGFSDSGSDGGSSDGD